MRTRRKIKNAPKKKMNTRVDFTPMLDMMMLLLTFFMFCTTLSRPQAMDIVMPVADLDQPPNTIDDVAVTFILAEKNKVYYYEGLPNYEDYTSLKEINYTQIRNVLISKNKQIVLQVNELTKKKNANQLTEQEYKDAVRAVKKGKQGTVASIKPTKDAVYKNLVDALDEMAICSIGRYAVVDIAEGDNFLIENYKSKGLYAEENSVK